MKTFLQGRKSYIIAGLMVCVALVNYFAGDIDLLDVLTNQDLQLLLEGLGIASLRAGMSNK